MVPLNVSRSTMAAQSRGSVNRANGLVTVRLPPTQPPLRTTFPQLPGLPRSRRSPVLLQTSGPPHHIEHRLDFPVLGHPPPDFTHAFRTVYRTTPTDYRHACVRAHPGAQAKQVARSAIPTPTTYGQDSGHGLGCPSRELPRSLDDPSPNTVVVYPTDARGVERKVIRPRDAIRVKWTGTKWDYSHSTKYTRIGESGRGHNVGRCHDLRLRDREAQHLRKDSRRISSADVYRHGVVQRAVATAVFGQQRQIDRQGHIARSRTTSRPRPRTGCHRARAGTRRSMAEALKGTFKA